MNILKIEKVHQFALVPTKVYFTDSGFDLYADENITLGPGETRSIKTGIKIQLPTGYEAQVRPRSGVSSKTGLLVVLGTVDQSYRGEIKVIVKNVGTNKEFIGIGDRIAQLVPSKITEFVLEEVENVANGERGSNGFGSSGL